MGTVLYEWVLDSIKLGDKKKGLSQTWSKASDYSQHHGDLLGLVF